MEWSATRFDRFNLGERDPAIQWKDGWVCPTDGLDEVAKIWIPNPAWNQTTVVQPTASHFIEGAIPLKSTNFI